MAGVEEELPGAKALPPDTLKRMPSLYEMTLEGGSFSAEAIEGGVRIALRDFYGWLDCYPLGTLEGIVLHHGFRPRVEMHLEDELNGMEQRVDECGHQLLRLRPGVRAGASKVE